MVERARLQRANIARKLLAGRCRYHEKVRARPASPLIDNGHQTPNAALLVLLSEHIDFGVDPVGDLLGNKPARVQREIAQQRNRENDKDQQVHQRQLKRRRAKELAEGAHRSDSVAAQVRMKATLIISIAIIPVSSRAAIWSGAAAVGSKMKYAFAVDKKLGAVSSLLVPCQTGGRDANEKPDR